MQAVTLNNHYETVDNPLKVCLNRTICNNLKSSLSKDKNTAQLWQQTEFKRHYVNSNWVFNNIKNILFDTTLHQCLDWRRCFACQ